MTKYLVEKEELKQIWIGWQSESWKNADKTFEDFLKYYRIIPVSDDKLQDYI